VQKIAQDIGEFIMDLFTPYTFATVISLITIFYKFYKLIRDKLDAQDRATTAQLDQKFQDLSSSIATINDLQQKNYRDIQKEVLRLQLLEGMDSKRLSESEVRQFYDKYHEMGGNSFVTAKVQEYVHGLEEDQKHED
jgi:hypothetical protein